MGGFRLEVTVTAKTLGEARRTVAETRLLDVSFWLPPNDVAFTRFKLDGTVLTKSALLANAHWMHQQAIQSDILSGDPQRAPSTLQIQGMTDVFASFGWNARRRNPTKSMSSTAWWLGQSEAAEELPIVAAFNKRYMNDNMALVLLQFIRYRHPHKYVPCRKRPYVGKHRYQVHQRVPIRLRYGVEGCQDHVRRGKAVGWFAKLIADGTVPREAVGMAPAQVESPVSLTDAVCSYLT